MKSKLLFVYFIFLQWTISFGQGINNLWLMGYDCCSNYFSPMNLNFSSGSLVIDSVQRGMNINTTNGEICDKNGNLLFYTNGIYVANAHNDTMMNGDGLNPSTFTTSHSHYGLTIPQANLIIPFPDDSMKYYLFHTTSDDQHQTYAAYYLYYSIIDMNLDSGLGAVVQKNTVLLNDTIIGGRLIACKHANGRDWWFVEPEYLTGNVFEYLVTPAGISGPFIKNLQTHRDVYFGQGVFSVQGDKFAYYEPYADLDIFDFDRCTGDFSNQIHVDIDDSAGVGGVAFSQSGRYLYVTSMQYVYQFDMYASDIAASKNTVAVWDGFFAPVSPAATLFYLAHLAPDSKIYINCSNTTDAIHVINYPDSAGLACDLCQHCIQLPAFNAFTIPNHPNYFLGAESGTACDSLHIDVQNISSSIQSFNLFPNPARSVLYITQSRKELIKSVNVFNSIGQKQTINYSSIKNGEYLEVNIFSLPSGIYFIESLTEKQKVVGKFIKE